MRTSVLKRLLNYLRPYKLYLFLALFSAVLSVCSSLFNPILIGKAVDCIVSKGDVNYTGVFRISLILLFKN